MGHLLGTAQRSLGTAQRRRTDAIPHVVTDVADENLASEYTALSHAITAAWATIDDFEEVLAPWGTCSARDALNGFAIETLVHGWDLAIATGQHCEAPDGLAESVSGHVMRVIPERLRDVHYSQPLAAPAGAGPTEHLAYLLGHQRPTR